MSATDYVQTRCQKCGAATWGHNAMTVACSSCGQPVAPLASSPWAPASPYGTAQPPGAQMFQQPAGGPPPGAQSFGQPAGGLPPGAQSFNTPGPSIGQGTQPTAAVPNTQGGPSVSVGLPFGMKVPIKMPGGGAGKVKMGAAVVGVAALAVGGAVVKSKMKHSGDKEKAGMLSYSSLKMDMKKIDADMMAPAVAGQAKEWEKDASLFAINLQAVHGDGTLDASGGGAVIKYISIERAQSTNKEKRKDSIKSFAFGPAGVDFTGGNMVEGFDEPIPADAKPFPTPRCGIKNVLKQVKGLSGDKTVRVTLGDHDDWAWRVVGEDPKIDQYFSIDDCSPLKP
jgi:hypothetical protein